MWNVVFTTSYRMFSIDWNQFTLISNHGYYASWWLIIMFIGNCKQTRQMDTKHSTQSLNIQLNTIQWSHTQMVRRQIFH